MTPTSGRTSSFLTVGDVSLRTLSDASLHQVEVQGPWPKSKKRGFAWRPLHTIRSGSAVSSPEVSAAVPQQLKVFPVLKILRVPFADIVIFVVFFPAEMLQNALTLDDQSGGGRVGGADVVFGDTAKQAGVGGEQAPNHQVAAALHLVALGRA